MPNISFKPDYSDLDNITGPDGKLLTPFATKQDRERARYKELWEAWRSRQVEVLDSDGQYGNINNEGQYDRINTRTVDNYESLKMMENE